MAGSCSVATADFTRRDRSSKAKVEMIDLVSERLPISAHVSGAGGGRGSII